MLQYQGTIESSSPSTKHLHCYLKPPLSVVPDPKRYTVAPVPEPSKENICVCVHQIIDRKLSIIGRTTTGPGSTRDSRPCSSSRRAQRARRRPSLAQQHHDCLAPLLPLPSLRGLSHLRLMGVCLFECYSAGSVVLGAVFSGMPCNASRIASSLRSKCSSGFGLSLVPNRRCSCSVAVATSLLAAMLHT